MHKYMCVNMCMHYTHTCVHIHMHAHTCSHMHTQKHRGIYCYSIIWYVGWLCTTAIYMVCFVTENAVHWLIVMHMQKCMQTHTEMYIPTAHLSGRGFSPASRPEKIPRECSGLVSGWVPATKSPLFSVRDDLARESSLRTEIDMSDITGRHMVPLLEL